MGARGFFLACTEDDMLLKVDELSRNASLMSTMEHDAADLNQLRDKIEDALKATITPDEHLQFLDPSTVVIDFRLMKMDPDDLPEELNCVQKPARPYYEHFFSPVRHQQPPA